MRRTFCRLAIKLAQMQAQMQLSATGTSYAQRPLHSASRRIALQQSSRLLTQPLSSSAVASAPISKVNIDWDNLGFGLKDVASTMYVSTWTAEKGWDRGTLQPYGPLSLLPSAQVLNYGQAIFEGMKAQHSAKQRIVLFRPEQNAGRFADGAQRMSMPTVPTTQFVDAIQSVVASNKDYVPPMGKGSLYIRPLLMGTGPILGLGPAPSYTFAVFAAAVGSYFKGGQLVPIDLTVEERFHRAAPGGTGGTKAAGNYSPVLAVQLEAKKEGFSDVVYLDAKTDTYLEEVSSCNIFVVKGKTIRTPPLAGTILPGVTRRSVIELARSRGYTVEEVPVAIQEAMEADEVFTTGTAVVVSSVGSLTYKGQKKRYTQPDRFGPAALEIYTALTELQSERAADPFGWVVPVKL